MRIYVMIVLGLMLWGCEGGSVLGPESMRVKFPTKGSTFYYETYKIDRFNEKVPGTTSEFSSIVVSTDTVLFGKTDIYVIRNRYNDTNFYSYYQIDDNLNLKQRVTLGNSSIWLTIPISTLAETMDTIKTTVDIAPGKRGTLEYVYMHSFYGDESFSIDTLRLTGRKFRSRLKYQTIYAGKTETSGELQSIDHYLPSLGMLGHSFTPARYDERMATWENGYVIRLKKYIN